MNGHCEPHNIKNFRHSKSQNPIGGNLLSRLFVVNKVNRFFYIINAGGNHRYNLGKTLRKGIIDYLIFQKNACYMELAVIFFIRKGF